MYSRYAHASYATLMDVLHAEEKAQSITGPRAGALRDTFEHAFIAVPLACVITLAFLALRLDMNACLAELSELVERLEGLDGA